MQFNLIKKEEFDKIRSLDIEWSKKMQLLADMTRYNTLVAVKKAGSGHLGSSLSVTDIVTYLYLNEMNVFDVGLDSPDRDIYFSSKGHDVPGFYSFLYAIGMIPEEKLLMLRRLNGLDGHPEVRQPGIEASTGSLGMGISKGKGMAWAKKYKGYKGHVYVVTGDGEFQEGQIYEAMQATAHQKVNNLTVIIDHNKYQTDMRVEDVNNIEDLVAKGKAFHWHVERINGHNYNALKDTFTKLKSITDKPKLIVADTIKGRGVSFMEKPDTETVAGKIYYKWHSGAPADDVYVQSLGEVSKLINGLTDELGIERINIPVNEATGKVSSKGKMEFVKEAYGEALFELGKTNENLVVIDGDLSADCGLRKFEYAYPNRFIENGIAEQDMASMAGGIARMGLIPVVSSFSSFLAARANEQIYNNAGEKTKIIYTCHFTGLIPAGPGKSHQSVRDISLFAALPNMTILQPCNAEETKQVVEYCVNESKENCMIRLVIGPSPEKIELPADYKFQLGIGAELTGGDDAVIIGYGPVMLHEALLASRYLKDTDYGLKVVNMPWLNKVNTEWIVSLTKNYNKIYVLEDHSVIGGLGDRIMDTLVQAKALDGKEFRKIGLFDYPECGTPWEVLAFHGLDGMSLAKSISGNEHLEEDLKVREKYTDEAPQ
ncbi:MAG: transketolase C-terminal domain-containing protein [Ignavibacteria bacterium]|jgi:transketolase